MKLIHERHGQMSKTYQRIAVYLTQNPNEVAVHSVNALAERCGVHASSFVRFAQTLGYQGFKELQSLFQKRLATAAPGFDERVRSLAAQLQSRADLSELGFLRDLVLQDIATLQELLEDTRQEDLAAAADLLYGARTIFLAGQLRSAPVVELMHYMLTMLGKSCVLLSAGGGLATRMARTMQEGDVLLAVSFRFYANETVSIVEEAGAAGIAIVSITDSTLSPIAPRASVLFAVPEHNHIFSRSLAAPICLAQALNVAVAARVQRNDDTPRIPTVTESQNAGDPHGPASARKNIL